MNRAVLVVLVDFLLISLVTLFSANRGLDVGQGRTGPDVSIEVKAVQDMLEVLQQALAQEQVSRTTLSNRLVNAEDQVLARQQALAEQERRLRETIESLRAAELAARRLAEERDRLQTAQTNAQLQVAQLEGRQAEAQSRIQTLQEELRLAESRANLTQAGAEALRTELAARRAEVERLSQQIGTLQNQTLAAQEEKTRLATNLVRVETEAAQFRARLDENRQQMVVLSEEKERMQEHAMTLAKGIDTLAVESQNLATEIREDRQLAPNTIYKQYLDNRVDSTFRATRPGILGLRSGDVRTEKTVLFRDAGRVFALFHIRDTPIPAYENGPDWTEMYGSLSRVGSSVAIQALSFVSSDPRILVLPLEDAAVASLGVTPFDVSEDPAKFQDAVIVGGKDGYYGEVEFKLVPGMPRYLKMQRRPVGKIFGKFSPSKGDLAFSKSGELLGMMVNSQYCALLQSMPAARLVRLGKNIPGQSTAQIGAEVARRLQALPMSLQ